MGDGLQTKHTYRNLDYLRSCAVLAVYLSHLLPGTGLMQSSETLWALGRAGVLLFFVHTALVLMQSIERNGRESLFKSFYVRRFFRIYPLSIISVIIVVALGLPSARTLTKAEIGWNLALSQNLAYAHDAFSALWSLPIEVQMYLFLPALFLALTTARRCFIATGLAVVLGAAQPFISGRADLLAFGPCFVSGILAYRLCWTYRLPAWGWALTVPGLTALFCAAVARYRCSPWLGWSFCVIVGLLIPRFTELVHPSIVRIAELIAKYSYGIYLSHVPLIAFLFRPGVPPALSWVGLVIGSIVIPLLLYHTIEEPMIEFGKHLTRRKRFPLQVLSADYRAGQRALL